MADPRFYAKIDVGYLTNPKVAELLDEQPGAILTHLAAILYCRQHLTDGIFPIRLVSRIASATYCGSQCESQCDFCAAVNANLLDRIDARQAEVHDYLKHQDSAEKVAKRKDAGQAGAAARWSKKKDADSNANRNADAIATTNAEERRGEERTSSTRKRAKHALPDDWKPNTKHQDYANENGVDLSSEAFRFRNHAHANDRRQVDWDAAFRMWLSKAVDFAPPKPKQRPVGIPEGW